MVCTGTFVVLSFLSWFIMYEWNILLSLSGPQMYFLSLTIASALFFEPHFGVTKHMLVERCSYVTSHARGNDGHWRSREIHCKTEVCLSGEEAFWSVRVSQSSPLFGGWPQEPPPNSLYFQTGGEASGLHMNLSLPRERDALPERASANVCTPSKHFCAAAPLHISHTLPCSQPPSIAVWLPNTPTTPHPPHIHRPSAACPTLSHGYKPIRTSAVQ